jgi:hypothetical protein
VEADEAGDDAAALGVDGEDCEVEDCVTDDGFAED